MRKVIFTLALAGVLIGLSAGAQTFNVYLYRGLRHPQVSELQAFLKQFPDIYPEGIVSGYFGSLTEKAVKNFQQKYSISTVGTVGPITRAKLNQLAEKPVGPAPAPISPAEPAPAPAAAPETAPAPMPTPAASPGEASLVTEGREPTCKNRKVPSEYSTVQLAIDAACAGDAILISPGTYKENLLIKTSGLILKSAGDARSAIISPDRGQIITVNSNVSAITVDGLTIAGDYSNIGVVFQAPASVQADVLIQNSTVQNTATAISVGAKAGKVTIKNNLILSNSGIGIVDNISDSGAILVQNNTIAKNGTGYHLASASGKHTLNGNIIVSNTGVGVEIGSASVANEIEILSASYNNVWDNRRYDRYSNKRDSVFTLPGIGNVTADPGFIAVGEYKLSSKSVMIDAGDPALPNDPDGTRADIGAFPYEHRVQQYRKGNGIFTALLKWLIGK